MTMRLSDAGWSVFVLADSIRSKHDFFQAVDHTIPLDPAPSSEGRSYESWDGLSDSIWGGIMELPAKNVLICWPRPSRFAARDAEEYEDAVDILSTVAEQLADPEATDGNPKHLVVLLADDQPLRRSSRLSQNLWTTIRRARSSRRAALGNSQVVTRGRSTKFPLG
jgi:Barstar (barnase inhibitor)